MGLIDAEESERPLIKYCDRCLRLFGQRVALGPRIYIDKETGLSLPNPPSDEENWLQCTLCGSVYAKHEIKDEATLEGVRKPLKSPFSRESEIKGVGESRRFDRSGKTEAKKKKKQDLSEIKGEDIRREMPKVQPLFLIMNPGNGENEIKPHVLNPYSMTALVIWNLFY